MRRLAIVAAVPMSVPVWLVADDTVGFVATVVAFGLAVWELRSWPCPRCGDPFIGVRWTLFPESCASCALPAFARPDIVGRADFVRTPTVRMLPDSLRRFVGGAEIAGGAVVIAVTPFAGGFPLWYRFALESVGAIALAAGIWLWRDDARGYDWSRILQALQIFRFSIPPFAFIVGAGPSVDLHFGDAATGINFGFQGQLVLLWRNAGPIWVSFNLLAAGWLLILLDARPRATSTTTGMRRFEVKWSEAVAPPTAPPDPVPHESSDPPPN